MKLYKLLLLLFICFISQLSSQEFWETIQFPVEIDANMTCIAFNGEDIYAGTDTKGVFFSSDKGENWTATKTLGEEPVKELVVSIDDIIWVHTGENNLYWTNSRGSEWTDVSFFRRRGYAITCMAVNQFGNIYVGTNNGIFKSSDLGTEWKNITGTISVWAVHTIGINGSDIFISIEGLTTGLFFSDNDGRGWRAINTGLPRDPIAKKFLFGSKGKIFTTIGNEIFYTINKGGLWVTKKEDIEKIEELLIDSKQNLAAYDGNEIILYSDAKDDWVVDSEKLTVGRSNQVILQDDFIYVVMDKEILKTAKKLEVIIAELLLMWEVTVVDFNNQPVKNKEFNLYKMYGINQHGMGKVTTDANGKFILTSKNFGIGNGVKVERIVYTKPSAKGSHQDVNNTMYRIKIDNAKFDSLGLWQFDTLTSSGVLTTKLCHTTVMFSLVVGVEWEAKMEYLVDLQEWFKNMNNYLYDVYDGQLYLEKIAIYDNQKYWKDVDMHFWASNMVWPNAFLDGITVAQGKKAHLPRKWFGNSNASRNYSTQSWWLTFANDFFWTTIAHEFGHYALGFDDEYMYTDTNKAKQLPKNYNYGYMNDQYPGHGEWSSELSNATRYPNDDYKITYQWATNKTDCWNDFEKMFENIYDGIYCPIIKPSERNNLGSRNYFIGPNDASTGTNSDVSYWLDCQIYDVNQNAGDYSVKCTKIENNKTVNLPKTDIFLLKSNGYIYQGKTDDSAKCVILGANIGDFGYATYSSYMNFTNYIKKFQINAISGAKTDNNEIQETEEIVLDQINGNFSYVSTLDFNDAGNLILRNYASESTSSLPVQYMDNEGKFGDVNSVMLNQNIWQVNFPGNLHESSFFRMNLFDKDNREFSIFLQYEISESDYKLVSKDGALMVNLDAINEGFRKFAILASEFLASGSGLPPNTIQAGRVYSIAGYPRMPLNGNNILSILYSDLDLPGGKEENIKLFIWNEDESKWEEICSSIDTARNVVQAVFTQFGTYCLFVYEPTIDVEEGYHGSLDFEIIPNPTDGNVRIRLQNQVLDESQGLTFRIFDIYGREMKKLLTRGNFSLSNRYSNYFDLNLSGLPSGVYMCALETKLGMVVRKFIKL